MRALAVLIAWGLVAIHLVGQSAPEGAGASVPTLRVFVDLIQVPVLVLNDRLEPMRNVDASRFSVSVDSGPAAHPRRVRVEGDDPIALGVFLDANARRNVMGQVSSALMKLVPGELHQSDHVTLFSMDCRLYRALVYQVAQPALLQNGVEQALRARSGMKDGGKVCSGQVFLWDAIYRTLQEMVTQQGRRVLIVVSDGEDYGSKHSWNDVRLLAQAAGVAIFGLANDERDPINSFGSRRPTDSAEAENRFRIVAETSGGIVLPAGRDDFTRQMARVMTMVRERYVVEFSRPRQNVPGEHDLLVKVAKGHPVVRPSGVSVSLPDPAVENDPSTIPRDTTNALELGKRKILTPKPQ